MEVNFETTGILFSPLVVLEAILQFSSLKKLEIKEWVYQNNSIKISYSEDDDSNVKPFFDNLRYIALTSEKRSSFKQRVHEIIWAQFDIDPEFYADDFSSL